MSAPWSSTSALGRRPAAVATLAVAAGAAVAGAGAVLAAYALSPIAALALGVALAVAIVIAARPAVGVFLAVAAVPLEVLDARVGGSFGLTPTEGLLLLTGGLFTLRSLTTERLERFSAVHATFGGLVAVSAVGAVIATDTFAVAKITAMWAATLAVSLMVASWDVRQIRRLLGCVALTGGVLGIVALLNSGPQEFANGGATVTGRAQGAFEHPNLLAFFLLLAVPVAAVLAVEGRGARRVVMACAAIAGIEGLILTLTRGAILGFLLAGLVLATWKPLRRIFVGAVLAIAVALVALPGVAGQSGQLRVLTDRLASVGDRTQTAANPRIRIWRVSLGIVAAQPVLGVGAGNFDEVALASDLRNTDYGRSWEGYDHPHNLLLTIAAELGLIGLGLMLALIAAVAVTVVRALGRGFPGRPLVLAIAAALTGLFAAGLTDYPIRANAVLGTAMIELGALVALERMSRRGRGYETNPEVVDRLEGVRPRSSRRARTLATS